MKALIYLHSDKDRMYVEGRKLGLTGNALSLFRHACCEVAIDLEVAENGMATIVAVEGRAVEGVK